MIDLHATLVTVHSDKKGAKGNFKGGFGYHPLGAWLDNTGEALAAVLRPGNAGSNTAADHLRALHLSAPQGAQQVGEVTGGGGRRFSGTRRGGHLQDHDDFMDECFAQSVGLVDVPALRAFWAELWVLPEVDDHVKTHGDLTPANVLVHEGRLAGVLDTGGFGVWEPSA